jgi:hypothetical protein
MTTTTRIRQSAPRKQGQTKLAEAKLILIEALPLDRAMCGLPMALVTLLVTAYVNTAEYLETGRLLAWPSVDKLAADLRAGRASVQRSLGIACQRGYLRRVTPGGGAGNPALYELLWREKGLARAAEKGRAHEAEKGLTGEAEKGLIQESKGPHRRGPTYFEDSGGPKGPPSEGERKEVSRPLAFPTPDAVGPAGAGPAPEEDQDDSPRVSRKDGFVELAAIYQRPWADDPREELRAWEAALAAGADPGAIIAGAKAWVAAADAPRFLLPLTKWLAAESWMKPPPEKRAQRKSGGKPQRMTAARAMLEFSRELRQGG